MHISVLALLLIAGLCLGQRQATLYPINADGFDTVELDDMSFVTTIHPLNLPPPGAIPPPNFNFTYYVFGGRTSRTVLAGSSFSVGPGFGRGAFAPAFIDIHSFQIPGQSTPWFIGPVDPYHFFPSNNVQGYDLEISVFTPNFTRHANQPIGFDGTFFAVRTVAFDPNNVIAYFAGYFLDPNITNLLHYGVYRAHLNLSSIQEGIPNVDAFSFNYNVDAGVVVNQSMFISFNQNFKPFLFHFFNVSWNPANPNATYTYVVDPYFNGVFVVLGNTDPTQPLVVSQMSHIFQQGMFGENFQVVSANVYYPGNLLIVGLGVPGIGTGYIVALHLANVSIQSWALLPTNFSDPRALVIDEFEGNIYIGGNGGPSILRMAISNLTVTGQQPTPFYLHRVWSGSSAPGYIYFVTNEQHSKVFRVAKADFCPATCPMWGYCQQGKCVCPPDYMVMIDGQCQWKEVVTERETIKTEHGGEVALGILFMFSFIAAAGGWYMWWRLRSRNAYQSV